MSSFVLCDDNDWERLYQPEYYKYFRIKDAEDLLGHPQIRVFMHEDWHGSYGDDRIEYLEQQIEILAKFGYIHLVYKWSDGKEEEFKVESKPLIPSPQMEMFPSSSSPSVAVYEREDSDCESGACSI